MNAMIAWLLTFAMHGALFLTVALAIDSAFGARGSWREWLWRTALFGAVLTSSLQMAVKYEPLAGRWPLIEQTEAAPAPVMLASDRQAAQAPVVANSVITPIPAEHTQTLAEAPPQVPSPRRDLSWIMAFWLAGVVLFGAKMLSSLSRLRRLVADAQPYSTPSLDSDLNDIAHYAGIAAPRLLSLDGLPSPIVLSGARIVVPEWAITTLDREQLRAMLAHETAHIARHDVAWKRLAAVCRSWLWFLPMAAIAQRRLDEIAEFACDAFAARWARDGHSLAECLAACAEHYAGNGRFDLAPAMAARQSSLMHRIERLLEGVTMESRISRTLARSVAFCAVAIAAVGLPSVGFDTHVAQAAAPAPSTEKVSAGSHSINISQTDDDGHSSMFISESDDGHTFKAKVDGKMSFNADESDVVVQEGTVSFEEVRGGVTRRMEIANRNGKEERRYFVNGSEQPIDEGARAWMAQVVTDLARSGIGAEARVDRLYNSGGAPKVLAEIDQIHSDYVRRIYLEMLLKKGSLKPGELDHALQIAGAMSSDYERRQALSKLFDTQALQPAQQTTFLQQTMHFESDYERAELLVGVVPRLVPDAAVRQAWLDSALKIHSDYEQRRALDAMLAKGGLDDAQIGKVMEASAAMNSDYEHRELLAAALKHSHNVDAVSAAYTRSVHALKSDYEHREALLAIIHAGKPGPDSSAAILDSAAGINSSYDCREVLIALAPQMPDDPALLTKYRAVAAHLSSYDRGQAEQALTR